MISTLPNASDDHETHNPFWRDPLALLATVIFLAVALRFFNYCEDDVFIPMRYALNFWHGHGLVMNAGERVDGCTSPLQLWLCVGLLKFLTPDMTLLTIKSIGLLVGIAVMFQARELARLLLPSHSTVWRAVPLLLAIDPLFALSMINGLETSLATFFLVTGTVHVTRDVEVAVLTDRPMSIRERLTQTTVSTDTAKTARFWFCAAALTRPELTLTFPLILLLLGIRERRVDWRSMFFYLVPIAAYCVFRLEYYGDWLPNTYYAKQLSLRWGLELGWNYIQELGYIGAPPLWMTALAIGFGRIAFASRAKMIPVVVTFVIHVLFLLRSGGDWMIDGRFFAVILPITVLFLAGAGQVLVDLSHVLSNRYPKPLAIGVVVCLTVSVMVGPISDAAHTIESLSKMPGLQGIDYVLKTQDPYVRWMGSTADGRMKMAKWIDRHAEPGQTVLVGEVGLVPIANMDVNFIDVCGLTDSTIARMTGYPRGRGGLGGGKMWMTPDGALPHYIHRRKPEWVMLLWSPDKQKLEGSNDSDRLYVPVEVFPIQIDGYTQYVATWRRRDVD